MQTRTAADSRPWDFGPTSAVLPGTQHGFNKDTTPRYDKDAAALAWKRTIEFFNKNLG